jgi:ABC-type oligopeptide transport system substrate-binding subunit
MALYDGLVEYDPKTMEPIPSIAERWVVNEDATEFVFFLRHTAKFSNGDSITAKDFVYTFRRGFRPELASRTVYLGYDIKYAEAYNTGGAFVRDPTTGRFLLASDVAPTGGAGNNEMVSSLARPAFQPAAQKQKNELRKELSKKDDDVGSDSAFHRFIRSPERLIVPFKEKDRQKAINADKNLASLVEGKEFIAVRAEDIGVEAVDDYTLRVTTRQPAPYFIGLVAHQFFRVISEKIVDHYGVNWTNPENFVGSGPFKIQEHEPYEQLVVTRNPYYWDASNVHLDKIVFYPLEEQTTVMNLYKVGEVDATYNHTVPAAWLKSGLRSMKDYMDTPENACVYWQINTKKKPMDDKHVRQAFNLAIDRDALAYTRAVSKANGVFVPEGILHGYPSPHAYTLDVQKAKQLLADAGFKDAGGNFDPTKFPADRVEVFYNTGESNRQVAEFVQAQWKQNLGITIPIRNTEWRTFLSLRSQLEYTGFAGGAGFSGDYMDPYTYLVLFATEGGDNGTGWYDPTYVHMLNEANRQPNQAKRYEMLSRAEAYMLDAAPVIPLLKPATSWMKKPYVKGMYPNPGTLHPWKYVYIEHDPAKWDRDMPDMTPDSSAQVDTKK